MIVIPTLLHHTFSLPILINSWSNLGSTFSFFLTHCHSYLLIWKVNINRERSIQSGTLIGKLNMSPHSLIHKINAFWCVCACVCMQIVSREWYQLMGINLKSVAQTASRTITVPPMSGNQCVHRWQRSLQTATATTITKMDVYFATKAPDIDG